MMRPVPDRRVGRFGVGFVAAALLGVGLPGVWCPRSFAKDGKAAIFKPPPRDWAKAPAVVEVDTTENLYALGDVHGDYDRLVTLLAAGKLIDGVPKSPDKVVWKAGKAVLVCTGDLIDKGHKSLPVIALLKALRCAAAAAGGRVIVTMGNHEAEFLAHPEFDTKENKKDQEFVNELAAAGVSVGEVAAGTDKLGIGTFFLSLPVAARVNDWFFCHAGNTKNLSIRALTSALQDGIDSTGYGAPILSDHDSLVEARMHPAPWWTSRDALATTVKALGGVNHLVFGHQPGEVKIDGVTVREKGRLTSLYDGLVFMIDVGMSTGIGGEGKGDSQGYLLRVHKKGTEGTVIDHHGHETTIWTKR